MHNNTIQYVYTRHEAQFNVKLNFIQYIQYGVPAASLHQKALKTPGVGDKPVYWRLFNFYKTDFLGFFLAMT